MWVWLLGVNVDGLPVTWLQLTLVSAESSFFLSAALMAPARLCVAMGNCTASKSSPVPVFIVTSTFEADAANSMPSGLVSKS